MRVVGKPHAHVMLTLRPVHRQMGYALSNHAAVRTQQRGVPDHLIDALMSYAELEALVGSGCTVLRMTRDRIDDPDWPTAWGPSASDCAASASCGANGPAKS